MSSFHFCLSAAKKRNSFQLLPTSLVTDLLQLVLGLPLFLLPWGFHSRADFGTSLSSFLNVWPIHLNFLFLISKFISSWPVALHKSLLEIICGHRIRPTMCSSIILVQADDLLSLHLHTVGSRFFFFTPLRFTFSFFLDVLAKFRKKDY